jgi:hypothetical protein
MTEFKVGQVWRNRHGHCTEYEYRITAVDATSVWCEIRNFTYDGQPWYKDGDNDFRFGRQEWHTGDPYVVYDPGDP